MMDRLEIPDSTGVETNVDLHRRQFMRVAGVGAVGTLVVATTACPKSEKINIYVQTISTFVNEVGQILPAKAALVAKIVKVASDFNTAYARGDLASATSFFNSLNTNLTTLLLDLGANLGSELKIAMALAMAAVKGISILLSAQGATQPAAIAAARAKYPEADKMVSTVQRLSDPAGIDALFNAAKLQ